MGANSEEDKVLTALYRCLDGKPEEAQVFTASTMSAVAKGLKVNVRPRTVEAALRRAAGCKKIWITRTEDGLITISRRTS